MHNILAVRLESVLRSSSRQPTGAARAVPEQDRTVQAVGSCEAARSVAMRELARRWQLLDAEVGRLDGELDRLVAQAAPQLPALLGVDTDVAGALLSPPATTPSGCAARLASRACAAWRRWRPPRARRSVTGWTGAGPAGQQRLVAIVMVRLAWDPRTRAYAAKSTRQGRPTAETIRCLTTTGVARAEEPDLDAHGAA